MIKVVKFGGTSLANLEQWKKVIDIVESDKTRKYVVVSAPGKRTPDDTKVTDLLYKLKSQPELFGEIVLRFSEIISGLGLKLDF